MNGMWSEGLIADDTSLGPASLNFSSISAPPIPHHLSFLLYSLKSSTSPLSLLIGIHLFPFLPLPTGELSPH